MFKILVVEDDKNIRKLMSTVLKSNNYLVETAENGFEALNVLEKSQFDLVLLDISMPQMDGFDFTNVLRSNGQNIPILVMTAKHLLEDKRRAFSLGVDDYVVKPIEEEELLMRIKALLRRSQSASEQVLKIGNLVIDYNALAIINGDEIVTLPKKEFYILYKLLANPNHIYTRFQLMEEFWGYDTESEEHTVSVHINRIRSKTESFKEFKIITLRGLGYKAEIYEK